MALEDSAREAWKVLKERTDERLREEMREALVRLIGGEEVEFVEDGVNLTAIVAGVKFRPDIGSKHIVIKEAVTGVRMVGTCPKCGDEEISEPLDSLGEVGRNIASFTPQTYHVCTYKPAAAEPDAAEQYYSWQQG